MSVEFSSTAPTAPSGKVLGQWQYDSGTGKASVAVPDNSIANGGTGQTTQQAAIDALTGTQSAGKYLRSDGTHATLDTLHAADLPAIAESQVTNLTTDLAAKAPLASPTFTGTPAAPTPLTSDNSTSIATTAWVKNQGYGTSSATGTVTSVALTAPSWLSVSGSPITTSGTLAVTAATGQTANQFLATPNGSTGAIALRSIVQADLPAQPVDIPCSLVGKPGASAIVLIFTATRAISFAANFSGSYGTVGTNPTATASYSVLKNGSSIGTVSISTSGVFTFTTTSGAAQSLAAGDRLTITAPSSQDATLSDVGFTLSATR